MVVNPTIHVDLDVDLLLKNLRTSRRGAAAGPSGMTTEHLKILLDSTECCALFGEVATLFARGQIPPEILEGVTDRFAKAGCGSPGDRGRGCDAQVSGQDSRPAIWTTSRGRNSPVPVRTVHKSGNRVVQALTSMATILSIDGVGRHDFQESSVAMGGRHG